MTYQKNIKLFGIKSELIKKTDNKPVYNKEYLKAKMKCYGNEVTDFIDKEIPKVDSNHTRLAVISLKKKMKVIICKCASESTNTLRKK